MTKLLFVILRHYYSFSDRVKICSQLHRVQNRNVVLQFFPRGWAEGASCSLPSNAEVKYAWSSVSTPLHLFTVWHSCGVCCESPVCFNMSVIVSLLSRGFPLRHSRIRVIIIIFNFEVLCFVWIPAYLPHSSFRHTGWLKRYTLYSVHHCPSLPK
jgi:hypothetical protein